MSSRVMLRSSISVLTSEQPLDGEQMICIKTQRHRQDVALRVRKEI